MTPNPLVDQIVVISTYATITIPANQVFQLVTSTNYPAGPFYYNILNSGSGDLFIAATTDAAVGPANAETLPAGYADNGIFVGEGFSGLLAFTQITPVTISVRVAPITGNW
jgi:hypothetical protein